MAWKILVASPTLPTRWRWRWYVSAVELKRSFRLALASPHNGGDQAPPSRELEARASEPSEIARELDHGPHAGASAHRVGEAHEPVVQRRCVEKVELPPSHRSAEQGFAPAGDQWVQDEPQL